MLKLVPLSSRAFLTLYSLIKGVTPTGRSFLPTLGDISVKICETCLAVVQENCNQHQLNKTLSRVILHDFELQFSHVKIHNFKVFIQKIMSTIFMNLSLTSETNLIISWPGVMLKLTHTPPPTSPQETSRFLGKQN